VKAKAVGASRDRFERAFRICVFAIVCLAVCALAGASAARAGSRQEKEALGSLTAAGNVYVNGTPVLAAEVTIFTGDTVLTGDDSTATFTMSGKGSFKIAPQTHLVFTAEPRYLAEMTAGSVVMTSFANATEMGLKIGNFSVAPVVETQESSSRIDRTADGSFAIACLDGSVGVIPLQGVSGQVLRTGQTVEISAQGVLGTPHETATPPASTTNVKKSHTGWIILGVAAAGGAGAAAALAGRSHSSSVSPATMGD
jgi:hypothetical protein